MSSFSVEKWTKFHADDLYHPKYQKYLGWFMEGTFMLSCLFYGFTAYIILTKSPKQMGAYKYTILAQLTFNLLYEALIFIYNPIFHFPIIAISYDRSFAFTWIDNTIFFGIIFFIAVAGAVTLLSSFITRIIAAFSTNSSIKFRISLRFGIATTVGVTLFVWTSLNIPLSLMCFKVEDSWISLEKTVPALLELRKILPNTFVINPNLVENLLTPFATTVSVWVIGYGVAFFILNILFVFQLKKVKKVVSNTTYSLQKMLHTSLIIQTCNMVIFFFIPTVIIFSSLIFQPSYGSWITNCQMRFSSLHLIVDAPLIIYSVKPYQRFVSKFFSKRKHSVSATEIRIQMM